MSSPVQDIKMLDGTTDRIEDIDMPSNKTLAAFADGAPDLQDLVQKVITEQPAYVGVYQPGDFKADTYRLVLPNPSPALRGRGFLGAREEICFSATQRRHVDEVISLVQALCGKENGPIGVRHILNPSTNKDEGLRLIWPSSGEAGEAEMADWPRRDALRRDGKTVQAASQVEGAIDGGIGRGLWVAEAPAGAIVDPAGMKSLAQLQMEQTGAGMAIEGEMEVDGWGAGGVGRGAAWESMTDAE